MWETRVKINTAFVYLPDPFVQIRRACKVRGSATIPGAVGDESFAQGPNVYMTLPTMEF